MFTIKIDGVPQIARRMYVSVLPQFIKTLAFGRIPSNMGARSIQDEEFDFSSNGTTHLKRNAECQSAMNNVNSNKDLYPSLCVLFIYVTLL